MPEPIDPTRVGFISDLEAANLELGRRRADLALSSRTIGRLSMENRQLRERLALLESLPRNLDVVP